MLKFMSILGLLVVCSTVMAGEQSASSNFFGDDSGQANQVKAADSTLFYSVIVKKQAQAESGAACTLLKLKDSSKLNVVSDSKSDCDSMVSTACYSIAYSQKDSGEVILNGVMKASSCAQ